MGNPTSVRVAQRITVILEGDLVKKLRKIQAKKLKNSTSSISFSKVINETLKETL